MRRENVKALLGSQNCIFDEVGVGYKLGFQGKVKQFKKLFSYTKSKCFNIYHLLLLYGKRSYG